MTSVLSLPPEPQPAFGSTSPPDEGVDGWVTDEDDSAPLAVTRGAVIVNCNNRDTKGAQRRAGSRFKVTYSGGGNSGVFVSRGFNSQSVWPIVACTSRHFGNIVRSKTALCVANGSLYHMYTSGHLGNIVRSKTALCVRQHHIPA